MDVAESLGQLALFADLTPSQVEAIAHSHQEDVFAEGERNGRTSCCGCCGRRLAAFRARSSGGRRAAFPTGRLRRSRRRQRPGGLQTSYWLRRFGVRHAALSRDDAPAGMFQRFPIFQRLITWTKPDAPVERTTREYEWYDHNSLLAEEPELKALVPSLMDRAFDLPSRAEMEAGIAAFATRAGLQVRYGCTWESMRLEGERVVLVTNDGEYRCRAVVFALGVTEPWRAPIPGIERAAHYVDTSTPERYAGRSVFIVGKRNSGFEVAQGILPWARTMILGSPRPVQSDALALSALRVRYLHPYDEYARGGPGTYVLDVTI